MNCIYSNLLYDKQLINASTSYYTIIILTWCISLNCYNNYSEFWNVQKNPPLSSSSFKSIISYRPIHTKTFWSDFFLIRYNNQVAMRHSGGVCSMSSSIVMFPDFLILLFRLFFIYMYIFFFWLYIVNELSCHAIFIEIKKMCG